MRMSLTSRRPRSSTTAPFLCATPAKESHIATAWLERRAGWHQELRTDRRRSRRAESFSSGAGLGALQPASERKGPAWGGEGGRRLESTQLVAGDPMATQKRMSASAKEIGRLVEELEKAEAYEQRLRQFILDAKDQLASGNTSVALSILNQALNYIDSAADVVTGTGTGSSP